MIGRLARIGVGLCCVLSLTQCQAAPAGQAKDTGPSVEFDLPADQVALLATAKSIRFIIGYFPVDGPSSQPLFTYEVPGSQVVQARRGTVRVALRQWASDAGRQRVVLRIRSVTARGQSEWSAPSEPVATDLLGGLPPPAVKSEEEVQGATEAKTPTGAKRAKKEPAPGRKPAASPTRVEDQLRADAALRAALERRFPDVNLAEAAAGYRAMLQFVAALCAASNLHVRFEDMKPLTIGGEKRALEQAVRKLRPTAKARAEARKAQREANKIVRAARGGSAASKHK